MKKVVLALVVITLLVGGAGAYFFLVHRPNSPGPRYMQIDALRKLEEPQKETLLKAWRDLLANDQFMDRVVEEGKLEQVSGIEKKRLIEELRERALINFPRRRGLQIGFDGKRKEEAWLNKSAEMFFAGGVSVMKQLKPDVANLMMLQEEESSVPGL